MKAEQRASDSALQDHLANLLVHRIFAFFRIAKVLRLKDGVVTAAAYVARS
jgi:hypothetical protein